MSTARLTLVAATFALLVSLVVLTLASGSSDKPPGGPPPGVPAPRVGTTDGQIAAQQAIVRERPREPQGYVALASAYLQKVRETGDASFYNRADASIARALELDPRDPGALATRGVLKLARHDFAGGLVDGRRAHALVPDLVQPYGVLVDALVELGRYPQAERALQTMVKLKPNLSSYARVSYLRELHGDMRGATRIMRLAVSAGGGVGEAAAYVETLLGNLQFAQGEYGAAQVTYQRALTSFADYVPAQAGLANVSAARGRLPQAIEGLRSVVQRLPLPQYVVALGEAELASGQKQAARRDLELVRVQQKLLARAGVNTDVDLALFEADHGDPARGVKLARRAWAQAPSVRSADAMEWALTRAGRARDALRWLPRALKLGSRDPSFLFHAGMTERAAGEKDRARKHLRAALAQSPRFSPLKAPQARRALEDL